MLVLFKRGEDVVGDILQVHFTLFLIFKGRSKIISSLKCKCELNVQFLHKTRHEKAAVSNSHWLLMILQVGNIRKATCIKNYVI